MNKFFIKTFGCQMNEYDSERMAGSLSDGEFEPVKTEEEADYIILNTCSVRKHAEERAMSYIGRYVTEKKVIVAGCMAQSMQKELLRQFPKLFAVVGTANFSSIADIIKKHHGRVHAKEPSASSIGIVKHTGSIRGYLAIMQGCDNFCAYCIVPYVRGRERSRPADEVITELKNMAAQGYKEVTLLGQNVNSYHDKAAKLDFPDLLKEVVKVSGIERFRFMTSHPKDLSDKLIETVASEPKLCRHFHLPLQSGDDKVLEAMNRKYTYREFREKVLKIRKAMKDCSVTTDILLGFPGETEEAYQNTVKAVKELRFDDAYIFKYSVRKGTKSASMEETVTEKEKLARLNNILDLQKKISEDITKGYVGKTVDVLVYAPYLKQKGEMKSTSGTGKWVLVKGGKELMGKIITVKITEQRAQFLGAEQV